MTDAFRLRFFRAAYVCLAFLAGTAVASAQGKKASLTDDFPELSPKERLKIAAKEGEESQKDQAYQDLMRTAELDFQEGRYEQALAGYEKARVQRPYNVYPKVKIEDLRALLAKQAVVQERAPEVATPISEPPKEMVVVPPAPTPVVDTASKVILPPVRNEVVPQPEPVVKEEPLRTLPPPAERSVTSPQVSTPATTTHENGMAERRYQEGHAFVIERTIIEDGRAVVYKRVSHAWGQAFYFEDGVAVDERVWKARFAER